MALRKLATDPRLPAVDAPSFRVRLFELFREVAEAVNGLRNEGTSAPTTGTWKQGDFVHNTAPSETGSAGSKYVVVGWVCTVGGTPGTWLASRALTGN